MPNEPLVGRFRVQNFFYDSCFLLHSLVFSDSFTFRTGGRAGGGGGGGGPLLLRTCLIKLQAEFLQLYQEEFPMHVFS